MVIFVGDKAYDDVSSEFRKNGLASIEKRLSGNFIKDGGNVRSGIDGSNLTIEVVLCPAYRYMLASGNPFDKPVSYYCDCCIRMNSRVISNAGYELYVYDCNKNGQCRWNIKKADMQSDDKGGNA